ncbi:MAG: hypothetical protein A2W93_10085 [Bacteroidetes bacterium GWF2_43_63]|nr:MAG: hypothetical protein A2W94_02385 [Bacteroidetes bacterium GWE2_42_42]OFY52872.1 MAG: hypothetical protein A2W93_10085 [Bacteroidetes bacterium GWF2_43_63]HBG70077.1 hypothetical protein [Bacteroidales bacterium]HCB62316.1 hypothetical protein [Bacteroidales bacterium]
MRKIECFGWLTEISAVSFDGDCLVGRRDLWDSGAAACGIRVGIHKMAGISSRGGHERAFTYDYVKLHIAQRPQALELPAPHDLSASQSEAARSECVVLDKATQHDLLSSGGNKVWFATIPPDMEASCRPNQQNGYSSRYTFSAKEKDDETQYSYFGARYYDSDLSVWLSVDPMSDDYQNLSPFAYCANNPVMLVDPDGMKIDPTKFIENAEGGQANYDLLEADLESKTGLKLEYHSDGKGGGSISYETTKGFLGRNKPVIDKEGTSGKARRMLLRAINSDETLDVDYGEYNEGFYKKNLILLNPKTIQEQIDNTSSDLNNTTFGWALTYFHEFSHTPLGDQHKDPSQSNLSNKYKLGGAVRSTNRIRGQLGTDYGRRSMYFVIDNVLPFSREGRRQIKHFLEPTEKIIKY